jgi:hypothetical protein
VQTGKLFDKNDSEKMISIIPIRFRNWQAIDESLAG